MLYVFELSFIIIGNYYSYLIIIIIVVIINTTVEVDIFAQKNVCNFSNPTNIEFFCELKLIAIFYSV